MFSPPQHFTHLGRIWHAYLVAKAIVKGNILQEGHINTIIVLTDILPISS